MRSMIDQREAGERERGWENLLYFAERLSLSVSLIRTLTLTHTLFPRESDPVTDEKALTHSFPH